MHRQRAPQIGFTLLELLISIVVLVIVGALAIPGTKALAERGAVTSATNEFIGTVMRARSDAAKLDDPNGKIVLCPFPSNSSTWSPSWRIREDNCNGTVIRVGYAADTEIVYDDDPNARLERITFNNVGHATFNVSDGSSPTMVRLRVGIASRERFICLLASGKAYASDGACT